MYSWCCSQERILAHPARFTLESLQPELLDVVGHVDFGGCVPNDIDQAILKARLRLAIENVGVGSLSIFALPAFKDEVPIIQAWCAVLPCVVLLSHWLYSCVATDATRCC